MSCRVVSCRVMPCHVMYTFPHKHWLLWEHLSLPAIEEDAGDQHYRDVQAKILSHVLHPLTLELDLSRRVRTSRNSENRDCRALTLAVQTPVTPASARLLRHGGRA